MAIKWFLHTHDPNTESVSVEEHVFCRSHYILMHTVSVWLAIFHRSVTSDFAMWMDQVISDSLGPFSQLQGVAG